VDYSLLFILSDFPVEIPADEEQSNDGTALTEQAPIYGDRFMEWEEESVISDSDATVEDRHTPLYPGAPIDLQESLTAILSFVQSEHITGSGLARLLTLIDLHLPKPNKLLKSNHAIFKLLQDDKEPVNINFFCNMCYKPRTSATDLCDVCNSQARRVNYFISFSLVHQLKKMFARPNFVYDLSYPSRRVKQNPDAHEDI
jgi:hypothetical protein